MKNVIFIGVQMTRNMGNNRRSDRGKRSLSASLKPYGLVLLGVVLALGVQGLWGLFFGGRLARAQGPDPTGWDGIGTGWVGQALALAVVMLAMYWLGSRGRVSSQAGPTDGHRAEDRKNLFLAMLGHELRNPLAGISSAAQLLGHPSLKPEQLARTAKIVERQVKHMTHLVNDLLDVSRVTHGQMQIDKTSVDLRDAVQWAIEQAHGLIQAKQHQLAVALPDSPVLVSGDLTRLVQVVSNLLVNAARYTPQGGQLAVTLRATEHEAEVLVQDNGAGISPDLLPHVFDFFVQAKRSTDRVKGGLGLGLSLVKNLVEAHGGQITLHSDGVGLRALFSITLPRLIATEQAAADVAGLSPMAPNGLTIAVVDDNTDAAGPLAMLLGLYGHKATVFSTAEALLPSAQALAPDVCIIDIGLPGMDGYALAGRLRAMPALANTTLVALTGFGTDADRLRALQAGFDQHFVKPVNVALLMDRLMDRLQAAPRAGETIGPQPL